MRVRGAGSCGGCVGKGMRRASIRTDRGACRKLAPRPQKSPAVDRVYRGTAFAYNSTVDTLCQPALPCPPLGARSTHPISSTLLKSGLFTSTVVTTFCGSSLYQRMLLLLYG